MDMHGVEFAALDTLQQRLARHAEDSSRAACIGTYPAGVGSTKRVSSAE